MTYLELVKRLVQESGSSNQLPATCQNQSGEIKRMCDWVSNAWNDIQIMEQNWQWMVGTFSFSTTASDYEYSPTDAGIGTTFANWRRNTLRSYLTSVGKGTERYMNDMSYDDFRDYYLFNTRTASLSQPYEYAIAPNKNLLLGPNPNDDYTIAGEYFKLPTTLSSDSDTPDMPVRFHMAIVWMALMSYGAYESAPEAYNHGEMEFRKMITRLRNDQLPGVELGGGLA